jgi:hypothetical protein
MALLDFCRAIRPSAPRSLEISVLPRGIAERRDSEYYLMRDFLSPLRMLRSIENSGIRDAVPVDILNRVLRVRNDDESNWVLHLEFRQGLVHELTLLAQRYESPELVFEIYKKLLSYAQVFERYTPFKVEMGFGKEDEWNSHSSTRPTSYCFRYEDLR